MLSVVTTTVPRFAASRASSGRSGSVEGSRGFNRARSAAICLEGCFVQRIRDDLGHPLFDGRKRPRSRDVHDFVDARVHGVAEVRAVDRVRRHAQAIGVRALHDHAQQPGIEALASGERRIIPSPFEFVRVPQVRLDEVRTERKDAGPLGLEFTLGIDREIDLVAKPFLRDTRVVTLRQQDLLVQDSRMPARGRDERLRECDVGSARSVDWQATSLLVGQRVVALNLDVEDAIGNVLADGGEAPCLHGAVDVVVVGFGERRDDPGSGQVEGPVDPRRFLEAEQSIDAVGGPRLKGVPIEPAPVRQRDDGVGLREQRERECGSRQQGQQGCAHAWSVRAWTGLAPVRNGDQAVTYVMDSTTSGLCTMGRGSDV